MLLKLLQEIGEGAAVLATRHGHGDAVAGEGGEGDGVGTTLSHTTRSCELTSGEEQCPEMAALHATTLPWKEHSGEAHGLLPDGTWPTPVSKGQGTHTSEQLRPRSHSGTCAAVVQPGTLLSGPSGASPCCSDGTTMDTHPGSESPT